MTTYTAPAGNQVDLPLFGAYTPSSGNQVDLPLAPNAEPPEAWVQPPDILRAMPWRDTVRRGLDVTFSHGLAAGLEISRDLEHRDGQPVEDSTALAWGLLQPLEAHRATGWRDTVPLEQSKAVAWRNLTPVEIARGLFWRDTSPLETSTEARWLLATPAEISRASSWRDTIARDVPIESRWLLGTMVYPDWSIPWGFAKPPRTLVDNPNVDRPVPPTPQPPPVYTPPPGDQVDLPFECRWREIPGDQVALPFRKYQCLRSSHVVENDVILKRVSTDETVDCMELSITGDIDSYTNGWSAVIAREDFPIVEPSAGPIEVVATINGQDHLLLLERWGEDDIFGAQGRVKVIRVQGRSVSAELDEPYSPRDSRFEGQAKTHWQLMQQELPQGSDWTLEAHPGWSAYGDNLTTNVPANTFSYTDLSPIQAIARIAEATGAVVQQVPESRTLRIVPRYVAKPWEWGATVADLEVEYGQIRSASLEFEPSVVHNGVYVTGETNGVRVRCERTGTAGPWLEPVVDQLITDGQFGLQRGIKELGDTGKRNVYTLELPIDGANEGLIQTGNMVNVIESVDTDWTGQSIAWEITGSRSADRGLEIWQRIAVERYRDE